MKCQQMKNLFTVLSIVFIFLGLPFHGCGGGDNGVEGGATPEPPDLKSLVEYEQEYQENLKAWVGKTVEFHFEEGMNPYNLGSFMDDGKFIYQPDNIVRSKSKTFGNRSFEFKVEVTENYSDASGGFKFFSVLDFTLGASKDVTSAYSISHRMYLSNISLEYLNAPGEFVSAEGDNAKRANQVVYGVYWANVEFIVSLWDSYEFVVSEGGDMLYGLIDLGDSYSYSESDTSSEYVVKSIEPVIIGYLIRDIERIENTPTELRAEISDTDASTIELTWNPIEGVDQYWIYYSNKPGIDIEDESTYEEGPIPEYQNHHGFQGTQGQTYYFIVTSMTSRFESTPSREVMKVLDANVPDANAGEPQTVSIDDTVVLDASGSFDPNDGIASYEWTQIAGPETYLSNPYDERPSFVSTYKGCDGTIFSFELAVTDYAGMEDEDIVNITIEPDLAVSFSDSNVEAAIRTIIEKPAGDICKSDLGDVTSLKVEKQNISDLSGLEHCGNLTELGLSENEIVDLGPISNLYSLKELSLGANQISDIGPIANLTSLDILLLYDNRVADLSVLSNLTALSELSMGSNDISDIGPIANLTSLDILLLHDNRIADLSVLSNLTALSELSMGSNDISDIGPIANLTSLNILLLHDNRIADLSVLSNLTALSELSLGSNDINDIGPISNLTSLKTLRLHDNKIVDLSVLSNLAALSELSLGSNDINDIGPIANLTSLKILRLHDNEITDVSVLSNLELLTTLTLGSNKITDISPIFNLQNLVSLGVGGNELNDVSCSIYIPQLISAGVDVNSDC